jgi:hypothetical protein
MSGRLLCRCKKWQLFFEIIFRVWDIVDGNIIYVHPATAWEIAGIVWDS